MFVIARALICLPHVALPLHSPLRTQPAFMMSTALDKHLQTNPNNDAYWQARGFSARPPSWQDEVARMKKEGESTAAANLAASKPLARQRLIGQVTRAVECCAKQVLGGNAKVHRKGSLKKKTDIAATSDLDLWIELPEKMPMTRKQKQRLAVDLLRKTFTFDAETISFTRVLNQQWSLVLECNGLSVDVVPQYATFRSKAASAPKDDFKHNSRAREAVRLVKDKHPNRWKGKTIERAVLQAQKKRKGMPNYEIAENAIASLMGA